MKLANYLQQKATDRDAVIAYMKVRITEHLEDIASRGALSETFTFLSPDTQVKNEIVDWLRREGFIVYDKAPVGLAMVKKYQINIEWGKISVDKSNWELYDRISSDVEMAKREGRSFTTFTLESCDDDDYVKRVFNRLRAAGHSIRFDRVFREGVISWK